jgi:hypothetical protein
MKRDLKKPNDLYGLRFSAFYQICLALEDELEPCPEGKALA